jgi:two-component system OmpR family response regulator/two-component system response regulator RstA
MKNSTSISKISTQRKTSFSTLEKSILLIEDKAHRFSSFKSYLESENFMVKQSFYDKNLITAVVNNQPDIVVINIPVISLNATDISESIRAVFRGPIIVLTVNDSEQEQISAFKAGVDDYLIYPITPSILKVRLNALLRRQPNQNSENDKAKIQVGDITLYPQTQECQVKNKGVRLSTFEFKLLGLLLTNVGKIMSRDSIYTRLLGREYNGEERTVDVRVSKLRDKLSNLGVEQAKIETVWGRGYILNEVVNKHRASLPH